MCSPTKTIKQGLGDVFTLGLQRTNLGNGLFRKIGNTVGNVLTLQAPNAGGPKRPGAPAAAPVNPVNYDSSGDSKRLEQIFAPIRANANATIDAQVADQMKRLRANQAARGVLRSGVADYPTTELEKTKALAKGGVEANLAKLLGDTEASRSLFNTQAAYDSYKDSTDFNRRLQLSQMIADANKKSTLQQIFEGAAAFAPFASAALGPGGFATTALGLLARGNGGGGSRLDALLDGLKFKDGPETSGYF